MALYGTQFTAIYNAWNTSINSGVVGDAANHSLFWVKDGTASATTNSAAEVDGSNIPGLYKVVITGDEASCILGALGGKSSTPHVSIIPIIIPFEKLPNALPGTYGGLPTTDSNNHIHGISGTLNQLDDLNNFDPASDTIINVTNVANITSLGSSGNIAQAVWEYSTRTITADDNINFPTSGELSSAIWNYETRLLTGGDNIDIAVDSGVIAQTVWEYSVRTLTTDDNIDIPTSGEIASTVWNYATRTLTSLTEDILDVNVVSVNGIPQTNVIISGTVLDIGFVPTRSEFETGDINTAAADHYNGRIIVFTTGTLAGQACTIQDYSLEGLYGHFTVSQLTSAPVNGDTFAIY